MLKKTQEMLENLEKVKNGDVTAWWAELKKMKHAEKYGARQDTLIDWFLWLQELVNYFNEKILNSHPVFKKIKTGWVAKNKFGKKLYFKFGE